MAETRAEADTAFDYFADACVAKYDRAVTCLAKDRADLPAFRKRCSDLSITHKFCFFGCAGHFEAFGEGFEAFETAPNDCCAWRRVLGSIEIAAQSCDGGDEELQIARC